MAKNLVSLEDEVARKSEATRFLSLAVAAVAAAVMVTATVIWLFTPSLPVIPADLAAAGVAITALLSYWLNRAGRVRSAAYLLVIGFLVETAFITVMFGGATGPIGIIYVFPILVGGIVIGINYGFFIATLAVILYLVMIPVAQSGLLPQIIAPPARGEIVPVFVGSWVLLFYLVASVSWYAASRLNLALRDVRRKAGELQTANEKLQASEEELRASNEELRASNEELRATEEELRATNEELQAANEELREAQEQLIRSEKLAAIGKLAGGVGHELRNPLGAIKNAVYYIKGKLINSELAKTEPRMIEFLGIMDDEISSSNKIINDLLNFSRVVKLAVSPTEIRKVMEGALSYLTVPENIEVINKLDANLPEVEIDADQIRQVFVNIATNAIQAMPEGGKLTIDARKGDKFLEVAISDTGDGISEDAIGKIFDPLFTTRAKGIGFGLAVCKSIIERHKGAIEVESKVGEGATFTIKLPLKAH